MSREPDTAAIIWLPPAARTYGVTRAMPNARSATTILSATATYVARRHVEKPQQVEAGE